MLSSRIVYCRSVKKELKEKESVVLNVACNVVWKEGVLQLLIRYGRIPFPVDEYEYI